MYPISPRSRRSFISRDMNLDNYRFITVRAIPLRAIFLLLVVFPLLSIHAYSQNTIKGLVLDAVSGEPIRWANVLVKGTSKGTCTDGNGRFKFNTDRNSLSLKISSIGYESKVVAIQFPLGEMVTIKLKPSVIEFPEIIVTPSDSLALYVVKRSIEAKEQRSDNAQQYTALFQTQFKAIITSVQVDSSLLRDMKIIELIGEFHFSGKDDVTEIIQARRVHKREKSHEIVIGPENTFRSILWQNLSNDYVFDNVTGPISYTGLKKYMYRSVGLTVIDGIKVYIIKFLPLHNDKLLAEGLMYIESDTYSMVKAEIKLNNTGLINNRYSPFIKIFQLEISQVFKRVNNSIWLPAFSEFNEKDSINIPGFDKAMIHHNATCIVEDYSYDSSKVSYSSKYIILPGADNKDSLYWATHSLFPDDSVYFSHRNLNIDSTKTSLDSSDIKHQEMNPDTV